MNFRPPESCRPVVASYVATFLKPEMLHLYRQLKALEHFRPVVITQKRENAESFPFSDVIVAPKPVTHPLRRIWQKQVLQRPITIYRSEAGRLRHLLASIRAALLHVYFGHIGVHLLPLLETIDLPVVVSFHGADAQVDLEKPAHLTLTRRVFARADLILARSQSLADRLVAAGCDRGKIRLHRTGIPVADFPFVPHVVPEDGRWQCIQVARLIPKKGLATTLRAFAAFRAVHPGATLTLAGEGPQLDELRILAGELGCAATIAFPGFLPQPRLRELFEQSHLFLHPSELTVTGDQEGVPNSMLEAMASGLPVVATRHGGIPEAVEHGISGLLVAEQDHRAVADAMLTLAADPVRYAAISKAASERVRSTFELGAQARVLEELYAEVLGRTSSAAAAKIDLPSSHLRP